jgi:hypothetical protein
MVLFNVSKSDCLNILKGSRFPQITRIKNFKCKIEHQHFQFIDLNVVFLYLLQLV